MGQEEIRPHTKVHRRGNALSRRNKTKIVFSTLRLMRGRFSLTAGAVSRETGVTRQTVRNLYGNVADIIPSWEQDAEEVFREFLQERVDRKKKASGSLTSEADYVAYNRTCIASLFIHLSRRREEFTAAADIPQVGKDVLRRLSKVVYEELRIIWAPRGIKVPDDRGESEDIFLEVMSLLIWRWCKYDRCSMEEAEIYIRKLERLTAEAMMRCKL